MKKTTKIIIVSIIVAMLLLGIGYAAISNITLNIFGTATANPNQENFKVMFTEVKEVSDATYVTTEITDDTNATIAVTGLTQKGETVSATYKIKNESEDLSADLSIATTNDNTEYFVVSSELAETSIKSSEETTVTVTVKLIKTPLTESASANVGVELIAMPVQPGQEGTSENINGSSQTPNTLSLVGNANIGDYIDIGNNIIGTENTTDDWRILYKDSENVYAILADYLPAEQVPEESGLISKNLPYCVASNESTEHLINAFLNKETWSEFSNGIVGATVIGTPTPQLLIDSYNVKNGTNYKYTESSSFDNSTEDYNLYVPHAEVIDDDCRGYWVAAPSQNDQNRAWFMWHYGIFDDAASAGEYGLAYGLYYWNCLSVRPVVSIPIDTECSYENEIWTVNQ